MSSVVLALPLVRDVQWTVGVLAGTRLQLLHSAASASWLASAAGIIPLFGRLGCSTRVSLALSATAPLQATGRPLGPQTPLFGLPLQRASMWFAQENDGGSGLFHTRTAPLIVPHLHSDRNLLGHHRVMAVYSASHRLSSAWKGVLPQLRQIQPRAVAGSAMNTCLPPLVGCVDCAQLLWCGGPKYEESMSDGHKSEGAKKNLLRWGRAAARAVSVT